MTGIFEEQQRGGCAWNTAMERKNIKKGDHMCTGARRDYVVPCRVL